jgi:hypothetical protein
VRPPVIIIGAHRSGTTATARALELLGLQLGQNLDSHHESKALQRLHEDYLRRVGASWHHPQPFIDTIKGSENARQECAAYLRSARDTRFSDLFGYRQNLRGWWLRRELKRGKAWGWKEPRTTLFAQQWAQVFGSARIVHVLRHPLAVALSIRQRELRFRQADDAATPDLDRLDYCLQLALTYVREGDAVSEVTPNYFRLRFESLQNKRGDVLKVLASFADLNPTEAEVTRAAASIHTSPPNWDALRPEDMTAARSSESSLQQLGYELPTTACATE